MPKQRLESGTYADGYDGRVCGFNCLTQAPTAVAMVACTHDCTVKARGVSDGCGLCFATWPAAIYWVL